MNLQPINPYQIIKQLTEENEALRAENEALRAEVAEHVVMERADNEQNAE